MMSVSRAMESIIRAGMLLVSVLLLLLSVCVCAPGTTVSFRRHRSQYLNFGLPNAQHRVGAQ